MPGAAGGGGALWFSLMLMLACLLTPRRQVSQRQRDRGDPRGRIPLQHGTDEPVLTVKTYKTNDYAHEAIIKTKDGTEIAKKWGVYTPPPFSSLFRCSIS